MVAQIIISHEDTTSFFSIGSVQDDASLVSALGGALASFAIEMGLSDIGATNANYSKFQNGVLISKWLEMGNYKPSLMIAIRDFDDLEQYHHMFLIDYGTILANKILSKFEKMYTGGGQVPQLGNALKLISQAVHELYKDSPSTLKEFTKNMDENISQLLTDIWENQSDQGIHPLSFRSYTYEPSKIEQMKDDFTNYFYKEGVSIDALFPLYFAGANDYRLVNKTINQFLKNNSKTSRIEIANEISKIVSQLSKMSSSRSRRRKQEIESVDLINADLVFEKIQVAKLGSLEKIRTQILDELYKTLLQKLYQNYPLKFLSCSETKLIDVTFIKETFEKTAKSIANESYSNTKQISKQIYSILSNIASNYTPDEVINQSDEILNRVQDQFIKLIKKEDPFLILADEKLKRLSNVSKKLAKEAFEQFRSAQDEAMALWYIIRQINKSISHLKTTTIPNLIEIHFLQNLVSQYQFRSMPKIVYRLVNGVLSDVSSSSPSKDPVLSLVQRNVRSFEKEEQISIPIGIKNSILKQFKSSKIARESFENIEALSFFSKAFSNSLELTVAKILEMFFGTKDHPQPPDLLSNAIEKIVFTSQGIYSFRSIIEAVTKQPGAQTLFSKDAESLLISTLKFPSILPSTLELARIAYETEWFLDAKTTRSPDGISSTKVPPKNFDPSTIKKDSSKISDGKLLTKRVTIEALGLTDKVSQLIKDPIIITELWVQFADNAFRNRYQSLSDYLRKIETKHKSSSGSTPTKKRYSSIIKKSKNLLKALNQLFSGGNFFQKAFARKKDLRNLLHDASREQFSALNFYPENFAIDSEQGIIYGKKITSEASAMLGSFNLLSELYASTWVRDSEYVRKMKEDILWSVLEKNSKRNLPLEKKILDNLQQEAASRGKLDQETVVRNTIEQEVSILFKKVVREAISVTFDSINDDLLVRFDNRTKDFYIEMGTIDIEKRYLQSDYEKMKYTKFLKTSDGKTRVLLMIDDLLPMFSSRKKKAHSMRVYLRDGLKDTFRTRHFKAFNQLGELVVEYIGEQAADLFFTRSRILEQLILESVDQR
ncbi:MAG: hypothetical protein ACTSQK_06730 [Candidatus Heimdallarchaeota archaeon]